MGKTKKTLFYAAVILGTLLILVTLLSLIYNIHFWFLKILDFPRVQVLVGLFGCLTLFVFINRSWKYPSILFLTGLVSAIIIQCTFVLPYTQLAGKVVKSVEQSDQNADARFKLLLANVWMKNRQAEEFLDIVKRSDPDIIVAMETNNWWQEQLTPLQQQYPYTSFYPLENTYGMLLYSKFPLKNTRIEFLQHKTVPSIHTTVELPNGKRFILHAMHPVPPKPSKYPDNVGGDEVALVKVGKMVAKSDMPTIVAGDFNDVAWSRTSRMFGRESKLGDIRIGRGLYNSFDAKSLILRWPLDHVFASNNFRVVDLKRLSKYGSDHFPILAELVLIDAGAQ
ncbi:endonuclease/exonuclease/phosphatase family protein [Pontibacter sp. MBLB2868]|uniref:endonuclease/exonuclease/phosphatase family protein n=1 Tax=Pontibacter sp. MBLB2868 TaxID=3451555 RepID=UPI003F755B54